MSMILLIFLAITSIDCIISETHLNLVLAPGVIPSLALNIWEYVGFITGKYKAFL